MMFIGGMNLPKKLACFVDERSKVNFAALEKQPAKLLRFYLAIQTDPLPTNDIEKASAIFIRQYIRDRLLTPGMLSHYHFIKLFCNSPELHEEQRKEEFKQHLHGFMEELKADCDNPKLLKRVSKVFQLICINRLVPGSDDRLFFQSFVPSDANPEDPPLVLPRMPFVVAFPAWRPQLVGKYAKDTLPVGMSTGMLLNLYQFTLGLALPQLSLDQLVETYAKARELQYNQLSAASFLALTRNLTSREAALQILQLALTHEDAKLIEACIAYLKTSLQGMEMRWTPLQGLEIKLHKPTDTNLNILQELSSYAGKVIFESQAAVEAVLHQKIHFPEVEAFELLSAIDPAHLNHLGSQCPKVKKCAMPEDLYQKLSAKDVAALSGIELLSVKAEKNHDEYRQPEPLFPHLKRFFYSYPRGSPTDEIELHPTRSCLQCFIPIPEIRFEVRDNGFAKTQENTDLITDDFLIELAHICPNLRNISLYSCKKFTEKGAHALACLGSLKALLLNDCTQLTDRMILAILSSPKKLCALGLEHCHLLTDESIRAFKNHIQDRYEDEDEDFFSGFHLNLSGCQKVTGDTIASILINIPVETLNLSHCPQITNSEMQTILSRAQPKIALDLSHCPQLTDLDPEGWAQNFPLAVLDLSYCTHLNEDSLKKFAGSFKNPGKVNFSGCYQLTLVTLAELAENHAPHVGQKIAFSFNDCPGLTDAGIALLASGKTGQTLVELNLRNCPQLTDAIAPHIKQMANLQELDLRDCPLVTPQAKQEIADWGRLRRFEISR